MRDGWHVETHVMEGRDVFLTDDTPLLAMCRRLRDEYNLPVTAMRPAEYLERRSAGDSTGDD